MKARDVLADGLDIGKMANLPPHIAERLMANQDRRVAALLATTPEGEGVYIAPDGTLMRVREHHTITASSPEHYGGDPDDLGTCYRLLPIEGGDRA